MGTRRIFFEQDMGTEANWILIDKLRKYHKYHLLEDAGSNIVAFSFYDKDAAQSQNHSEVSPFSASRARMLLHFLQDKGCNCAEEALREGFPDVAYIHALKELVQSVDVYGAEEALYPYLKRTVIDKAFVAEYLKSLLSQTNPYLERELNMKHLSFVKAKIRGMITPLLKRAYNLPAYASAVTRGMQVLCMPTTLVANRIPYGMLALSKTEREKIERALFPYFGKLSFLSEISRSFDVHAYGEYFDASESSCLRNIFSYTETKGRKGYVAVEMPFMDVGAWLRAKLFAEGYQGKTPVALVCLLEDAAQAREFYRVISYLHEEEGVIRGRQGNCGIYGLFVSREGPLFTHTGGGKMVDLL